MSPESWVRSHESGVMTPDSGVRSPEFGVRSQESGVRSQESGVRSQESGVMTHDSWLMSHESWVMSHDSGFMTPDSWLRTHDSGLRSPESGVRSQESGVRSQESGVRSQESGVRSQESGVRSPESGVRSPESGVRSGADFGLLSQRLFCFPVCGIKVFLIAPAYPIEKIGRVRLVDTILGLRPGSLVRFPVWAKTSTPSSVYNLDIEEASHKETFPMEHTGASKTSPNDGALWGTLSRIFSRATSARSWHYLGYEKRSHMRCKCNTLPGGGGGGKTRGGVFSRGGSSCIWFSPTMIGINQQKTFEGDFTRSK